ALSSQTRRPFLARPGTSKREGFHDGDAGERFRRIAGPSADQSPRGSGCAFGKTPQLFESFSPGTDRPALARQDGFGRPGSRDVLRGPPSFFRVSRADVGPICSVAAANPGGAAGQAGAPLLGEQTPRRPPRGGAAARAGAIVGRLR